MGIGEKGQTCDKVRFFQVLSEQLYKKNCSESWFLPKKKKLVVYYTNFQNIQKNTTFTKKTSKNIKIGKKFTKIQSID